MHKQVLHSTALWAATFTLGAFLFIIYGLRPTLRVVGTILGAMGGGGLEGTGL